MNKDPFGLCNSVVRIAEVVRGNGAIQKNLASILDALIIADCCRQEGRIDLAVAILDEIDGLQFEFDKGVREQLTNQRMKLAQTDSTPLIVFDAAHQTEVLNTPPLIVRGLNFAAAITRWISSGLKLRSRQEIDERLAICQACPQFVDDHCRVCGCPCVESNQLRNKLALASETCPLGKWT